MAMVLIVAESGIPAWPVPRPSEPGERLLLLDERFVDSDRLFCSKPPSWFSDSVVCFFSGLVMVRTVSSGAGGSTGGALP